MIIYTQHITKRVHYMAGWLGNYLFGKPLSVTDNLSQISTQSVVLNYSQLTLPVASYQIQPCSLLFSNKITEQDICVFDSGEFPAFFKANGQHPFDVLAAVFYLITRYEEYLPHQKDEYGRYWHKESIAFKNNFLHRPIVDEWMSDLKTQLKNCFPQLVFCERLFEYTPSYDIDIAWSYKNKELARIAGGFLKDFLKGRWKLCAGRLLALAGKKPDPFDVFDELNALHEKHNLNPQYFVLLAQKLKGYDKNISPHNKAFQSLIKNLAARHKTGIHPSWQSAGSRTIINQEINQLKQLAGKAVSENRMHYINFHLPATFDTLISLGIKQEYSMGYGTINGFRASTCTPYKWYNLATETETDLEIVPYCYMDANSIFEQKDSPEKALEELILFYNIVKKHRGRLVTIFHNHLVGLHPGGREWMGVLKKFLQEHF